MLKRALPFLLIICLILTGCSISLPKFFTKQKETPVSGLQSEALVFESDQSYAKTLELITSAKRSIYVQQSVFAEPKLMQSIIQKAGQGVDVRILLDQFLSANRATVNELKKQNISAQFYPARRGQLFDSKFLIVDQTQALVYSFPWTAEGFNSRGLTVRLTMKSVWKLSGIFNRDWQFTTTLPLEVPKESELPEDFITLATNANVKQQISDKIASSQQSILAIVTEVTDQDLIQAFVDAAHKGRDVRLILSPSIMPANWPESLQKLNASSIKIRYFKDPSSRPLAMNVGVFDGQSFIVSSSGWSYSSFVMDHELSLFIPSKAATNAVLQQFEECWAAGTISAK